MQKLRRNSRWVDMTLTRIEEQVTEKRSHSVTAKDEDDNQFKFTLKNACFLISSVPSVPQPRRVLGFLSKSRKMMSTAADERLRGTGGGFCKILLKCKYRSCSAIHSDTRYKLVGCKLKQTMGNSQMLQRKQVFNACQQSFTSGHS